MLLFLVDKLTHSLIWPLSQLMFLRESVIRQSENKSRILSVWFDKNVKNDKGAPSSSYCMYRLLDNIRG